MKKLLFLIIPLIFPYYFTSCVKKNSDLPLPNLLSNIVVQDKIALAHWFNDKAFAFSFCFDDNLPSQPNIIAPLLEKYNYRGTFAIVTGPVKTQWFSAFEPLKSNYINLNLKGHELANHSFTHPVLPSLKPNECVAQFTESIKAFEKLGLPRPITFIHPGNQTNRYTDSVLFSTHLVSRISTILNQTNRLPVHFTSTSKFESIQWGLDLCENRKSWLIFAGHGVNGDGWEPIKKELLEQICQTLSRINEKVWVAPMREVGLYERIVNETKIKSEYVSDTLKIKFENPNIKLYKEIYKIDTIMCTLKIPVNSTAKISTQPKFLQTLKKGKGINYILINFNICDTTEIILNLDEIIKK